MVSEMRQIQMLKFNGNIIQNWKDFIDSFKILMDADDFQNKSDVSKLKIFLDSMGKEGYDIFETFNIPAKEITSGCFLDKVIDRFDEYFMAFKNISVYNSCKFFKRVQNKNETFAAYLKEIEEISSWCQFGPVRKMIMRDRIISGIDDLNLQYKFKTMDDPSLEEVIGLCKTFEEAKEKMKSVIGETNNFFFESKKFNEIKNWAENGESNPGKKMQVNNSRVEDANNDSGLASADPLSDSVNIPVVKVEMNASFGEDDTNIDRTNGGANYSDEEMPRDPLALDSEQKLNFTSPNVALPRKRLDCPICHKSFSATHPTNFTKHKKSCLYRSKKNAGGASSSFSSNSSSNKNQSNRRRTTDTGVSIFKRKPQSNGSKPTKRIVCYKCGNSYSSEYSLIRHKKNTRCGRS